MATSSNIEMLPISELVLGFNDAVNYRGREDKEFLNQVFVRTSALDRLCKPYIYFLLGEKGTGKTAHAVYLTNSNSYPGISSAINFIGEAEYQKFIVLKKEKDIKLTDYTSIWKVILFLLMSQKIKKDEKKDLTSYVKFHYLQEAIDEFYESAFAPEIVYAINFAEDAKTSAQLISTFANIVGVETQSRSFSESRFQINLLYIQQKFEEALASLKLSEDHVLFIDGIDIRPSFIEYNDYLECVKGLADAVWRINTEFFSTIKKSKGRMRVVLLARPDIFDSIGLQNINSKIRDNSVLLDWLTTYADYRTSEFFKLADKLLSSQQPKELPEGVAWDYYFPYKPANLSTGEPDDSFIDFLRFSMYRPRDIITMLGILQNNRKQKGNNNKKYFEEKEIRNPDFVRSYSSYLLGEVKSQISFYHSAEHYELFINFFSFLNGNPTFSYEEYIDAYQQFDAFLEKNKKEKPFFFETADSFLQFLYELNVLCYKEKIATFDSHDYGHDDDRYDVFIRWCFRERNFTNLAPKIRTHARYSVHFGLAKALNLGKRLTKW